MNTLETSVSVTTADNKALKIDLSATYNSTAMRAHIPDDDLQHDAKILLTAEAQKVFALYTLEDLKNPSADTMKEISESLTKAVNRHACDDMFPVRLGMVCAQIKQPEPI